MPYTIPEGGTHMSRTFLVFAESRGGGLRQVSFETVSAARQCSQPGDSIAAALIGSGVAALADELSAYGVESVYVVDHEELTSYNPEAYFSSLSVVIEQVKPDALFFGHTAIGRDLAPMAAASLKAGQISDVIALENTGGEVRFSRPIYAGKAFEHRTFASGPWVVTIRPNNFPLTQPLTQPSTEPLNQPDASRQGNIIEVAYPSPTLRSVVKEVVKKTSGKKIDLSEAKIIVSGGRGVKKSAEGFKPLEELAALLNGAVGASRGACDAGYCDYSLQIGQTGKVVTPEIYIACGISGAIQHLAGMSQSRVIIAINKDPEAPIF